LTVCAPFFLFFPITFCFFFVPTDLFFPVSSSQSGRTKPSFFFPRSLISYLDFLFSPSLAGSISEDWFSAVITCRPPPFSLENRIVKMEYTLFPSPPSSPSLFFFPSSVPWRRRTALFPPFPYWNGQRDVIGLVPFSRFRSLFFFPPPFLSMFQHLILLLPPPQNLTCCFLFLQWFFPLPFPTSSGRDPGFSFFISPRPMTLRALSAFFYFFPSPPFSCLQ